MQGYNSPQFRPFLKENATARSILYIVLSVLDQFNRNLARIRGQMNCQRKSNSCWVEKKGNDCFLYERKNILTLLSLQRLIFFWDQSWFNKTNQSLQDKRQAHTSVQKIPYILVLISFLLPQIDGNFLLFCRIYFFLVRISFWHHCWIKHMNACNRKTEKPKSKSRKSRGIWEHHHHCMALHLLTVRLSQPETKNRKKNQTSRLLVSVVQLDSNGAFSILFSVYLKFYFTYNI